MKKREKKPEGGSDWMGTYGDMVTLLLCFFVMLYSISTVEESKWINFVKSMNPKAKEVSQIVTNPENLEEGTEDVPGANETVNDEKFMEMVEKLQNLKESMGDQAEMELTEGDGYAFITYRDRVFFDGDSAVLRDDGKVMLDGFAQAIAPASEAIKEVQVLGHTSQGDPNIPNEVMTDRILSGTRSAVVVAYIQQKNILDPAKFLSTGYGQFRPIDTFETLEGRARNRRVEILITKTGSAEQSLQDYYNQVYSQAPPQQ